MMKKYHVFAVLSLLIITLVTCLISITGSEAALDTTPPTIPDQLTFAQLTDSSVVVSWISSNDDVGVDHYEVYQNGEYIADSFSTTHICSLLSPDTVYEYYILSVDSAGNKSERSNSLFVKTLLSKLHTVNTVSSCDAIVLSWDEQEDVVSYEIIVDSTSPEVIYFPIYEHFGLNPGTSHTY